MVYMGKFMKFFVFGIALLSLTAIAAAEGNESINLTTNTTQEEPAVTVEEPGVTPPPEEIPEIVDFKLINFTPTETKQGDIQLDIPLNQEDIASLAAITRETVCGVLKKLELDGFLKRRGKYYIICNVDKLRQESLIYVGEKPLPYFF